MARKSTIIQGGIGPMTPILIEPFLLTWTVYYHDHLRCEIRVSREPCGRLDL